MDIIIQEWGLDASGLHSKEEILAALARRISEMLIQDPMGFIQLMYRLDIPEAQLNAALDADNSDTLIAKLVWDRQLQKSILRKRTPTKNNHEDDKLMW